MRVVFLLAVACGCQPSAPVEPEADRFVGSLTPAPSESARVVATVNEAQIYVEDVEAFAGAHGLSAEAALDELVGIELLAEEARKRGLADDAEVALARKHARAYALIDREFHARFDGPEDVPREDVEKIWKIPRYRSFFQHETFHVVQYVRAPLEEGADAAEVAKARALMDDVYRVAREKRPATTEEFVAIAAEVVAAQGATLETSVYDTTEFHGPASLSFSKAAFSVKNVGDVAAPARTEWGWDVLYLHEILRERQSSLEDATPEIQVKIFEESQRMGFLHWADALVAKSQVRKDYDLLPRVEVEASVEIPESEGPYK